MARRLVPAVGAQNGYACGQFYSCRRARSTLASAADTIQLAQYDRSRHCARKFGLRASGAALTLGWHAHCRHNLDFHLPGRVGQFGLPWCGACGRVWPGIARRPRAAFMASESARSARKMRRRRLTWPVLSPPGCAAAVADLRQHWRFAPQARRRRGFPALGRQPGQCHCHGFADGRQDR